MKIRKIWTGLVLGLALTGLVGAVVPAAEVSAAETAATETTTATEKTGDPVKIYKNQIVTQNGKKYYYDKNGKLVTGKYGYKIKGKYYKISKKGVLTQISKAQGLAGIKMNRYYGKSKSTALWKAFQWSAKLKFYTNSDKVPAGQKAEEYFAEFGFTRNRGDCEVQAATFCMMARALGYDAKLVEGYVPQALVNGQPSKFGTHAWVTIKMSGKTYVFDPNLYQTAGTRNGVKYGYKRTYGAKGTYRYFNQQKVEIK